MRKYTANHLILIVFLVLSTQQFSSAQNFGSSNHPMNKLSGNLSILNYWEQQSPLLNDLYSAAENVLIQDKEADYQDLIQDRNYLKIVKDNDIKILGGPMLGDIRSDGLSIWVRTALPASVTIRISDSTSNQIVGPQLTNPDHDLTTVFEVNGLEPETKYFYTIQIDDQWIDPMANNFFTTAPTDESSSPVCIAFGSCPHRWGLGNKTLWDRISIRQPDAMLVLGDIAVQDRNDHLGMHRADYLRRDLQTPWTDFVKKVPVYASWDDHDYFDNDEAGVPEGYSVSDKQGVRKVFKDSWNNPSYGLGKDKDGKGIFTKTWIGQCEVIMTDNRYFRTGQKGSFLGDEQMDWLKKALLDSNSPFIILSCGSMWSDYVSNGKDSWGVNDPKGREELLTFIEENNIGGVIFISGDRHGARGFTIPRESGMEFYEFEAASLGGRVGPPAKKDSWDTQLYGYDAIFAFGELTVHPEGNDPYVAYRLIKENGDVLYEQKIFRSQTIPGNFK